jgi:putative ABC transport system permease protein
MMRWNRRRRERDLDAELRAHLEMAAQDARTRGDSTEAARLAALREFGNRDLVKETTRDIWGRNPFHGIVDDLRAGLRTFRKHPAFAAVMILTLALGIGANTAIFSLIDAVMLRSLPVSHPEQLVQVRTNADDNVLTNPLWEQLRDHQDVFSGLLAYSQARFNLTSGGEAHYITGDWVSGDFFSTLGVGASIGRTLTAADDRRGCAPTAVLGYDSWQRQYGADAEILSRSISLNGHPFQIVGVGRSGFTGLDVGRPSDVYVPICSDPIVRGAGSMLDQRLSWWLTIIGRPKPGITARQLAARLRILSPPIFEAAIPSIWLPKDQRGFAARKLETAPAATGISYMRGEYRDALLIVMAVVGLLLLIACANVANLLLARAVARQREVAVRMALGAGRWRLMRQLLIESALFAVAGATLGALFAQWGSHLLVGLLSSTAGQVFFDLTINARVLAFTAAVSAAAVLLFGLAPAWRGTRADPQAAMKVSARGLAEGQSRFSLGKALVIAQVAVSLVLVVGAALLLSTFRNLATLDPGFDRDRVLTIRTDLRNAGYPKERLEPGFEEMRQRLASIPGVLSASFSNTTPISGSTQTIAVEVEDYTPPSLRNSLMWVNYVSASFFETLRTPLLAGRDFDQRDTASSAKVAIINQTAARKFFHTSNPLGRYFRTGYPVKDQLVEIVGVVKDATYNKLGEEQRPIGYLPSAQDVVGPFITFELRTAASPASLAAPARAAIEKVNPAIVLEFRTLSVQVAESLARERLLATLSAFFGGLALLLAAVGLYGVISHNMARRRNEIGIRIALGAERRRILRMAMGDVALVVSIGLAAGLAASLAATRYIASFLYGVTATDARTLAAAVVFFGVVAAVAGYVPARRASRLDPMHSLREE